MAKRKSVKKARGTKASRSAAAKKAARTRKSNAAKRSRSAKKAAATRKRNAGKRKSSAKKAAATRRRKSPKRKTKRKAAKRTRGPSKAKRSAAAKKGWRTRKAAKTKRSNAAKRAARTRKGKTTRRKTKRKAAPKRRKTGRMTKAKRSAAAKKGWRTRRRGGKRKTTRRKTKRKAAYRRTVKLANVSVTDAIPSKFAPFAGLSAGANAMFDGLSNPGKQFDGLMTASKYALAGMSMMGVLAVAKGEVWDRVGLTAAVEGAVGGIDIVGPDLVNAFDAMLDLATLGALGVALNKGLGIGKGWIGPGMTAASIIVAADFVRNINIGGFGDYATAGAADIRNAIPTSISNLTSMIPGVSGIGLGQTSNMTGPMFGTHNQAMGPNVGNNLALAMASTHTAATGNTHFFGTKSLGSTRVNLF